MSQIDDDLYNQYPLHLNPTSKSITLNNNHRIGAPERPAPLAPHPRPAQHPPPPLPMNPKRSAQISKLRDSANAAFRKSAFAEAARLYTYAIDMALGRPGWEPVTLARDELAGLYSNRAQAWMSQRLWVEGVVDARCSVECKPGGNVKAWWRGGKCLAEMGRWDEAREFVERGLEVEGRAGDGGKELLGLLGEVEEGSKRAQRAVKGN
ncbi:hypothetical protein BO70DRAFT_397253 [Aspergillus heteromorphus CBS 117.55]|uniref:Tetratricopeptide repeat domain protein n=1 Tax=Aspergillus heteromorphus CBS 117.55 TaxID=1448321 RepID=A0A317VXH6_9EURO|nr:uncharacterized protein BO70DRAFT_397253 [Aspergillus heteromorphus CBS 117.55]PWY79136.1 hypothetical protein BO70DRAFT_397253 [Aspergillus heteromorphus CBS 117.55]